MVNKHECHCEALFAEAISLACNSVLEIALFCEKNAPLRYARNDNSIFY
jgi:hypothetical protein